jgi:hypothetical protein
MTEEKYHFSFYLTSFCGEQLMRGTIKNCFTVFVQYTTGKTG